MISRQRFAAVMVVCGLVLAGCAANANRYAQVDAASRLNEMEAEVPTDPDNIDYVLDRMEFARQAVMCGAYHRGKVGLVEAFEQLESEHDNVGAAVSTEARKYYKGETYERAMLCFYLGYIEYFLGDFNTARIFFERALAADRAAVVKDSTPQAYGEDFGLAFYWLGKAYQKLRDTDAAAIAFKKARKKVERQKSASELQGDRGFAQDMVKRRQEGEAWAYRTFHDPKHAERFMPEIVDLSDAAAAARVSGDARSRQIDPVLRQPGSRDELLSLEFQRDVNLTLTIEVGRCPWKHLGGLHRERTQIARARILPHTVEVQIDGHPAGPAFKLLDLWGQAATQDRIFEKDAAQTTKSVLKEVLSHVPYIGSVAGYWDVSGDTRHWSSLPGRVYVYAARLSPGVHTIRLSMQDANGKPLPRWTNTYYGVFTPATGETCILLNPQFDGDNTLSGARRLVAFSAGARPGSVDTPYQAPASAGSRGSWALSGGRRR